MADETNGKSVQIQNNKESIQILFAKLDGFEHRINEIEIRGCHTGQGYLAEAKKMQDEIKKMRSQISELSYHMKILFSIPVVLICVNQIIGIYKAIAG